MPSGPGRPEPTAHRMPVDLAQRLRGNGSGAAVYTEVRARKCEGKMRRNNGQGHREGFPARHLLQEENRHLRRDQQQPNNLRSDGKFHSYREANHCICQCFAHGAVSILLKVCSLTSPCYDVPTHPAGMGPTIRPRHRCSANPDESGWSMGHNRLARSSLLSPADPGPRSPYIRVTPLCRRYDASGC